MAQTLGITLVVTAECREGDGGPALRSHLVHVCWLWDTLRQNPRTDPVGGQLSLLEGDLASCSSMSWSYPSTDCHPAL